MWYKKAQQTIDPSKVEPLDPNKNRQNIPAGGALEATLSGAVFNFGPDSAPQLINVETDTGTTASIILLHGTPDNMLTFPDDSGKLHSGTVQQFDEWRQKQGWLGFGWVACNEGKMVASQGADALINATGNIYVGSTQMPDGTNKIVFTQ